MNGESEVEEGYDGVQIRSFCLLEESLSFYLFLTTPLVTHLRRTTNDAAR